jgi:acylpyruvate hydrolase
MLPDVLSTAAAGLRLSVDGKQKQAGVTSDMLFAIPQLIEFVSGIMKLEEGDVILTGTFLRRETLHPAERSGTPSGVGPVVAGQKIHASLTYPGLEGKELSSFDFDVIDKEGGYEFKA